MTRDLKRYLIPVLAGVMLNTSENLLAEPVVFISAFAAGEDGAIHAYHLNLDSGRLDLIHRTTDMEHPFFMAVSPNGKFLYSIHAPGEFGGKAHEQIASYELSGGNGKLKLLNRQSTLGSASCYVDVDATGKSVLVANYATGSLASYPVREDGSLGKAMSFIQHEGSSIDASRQEGPHAHCSVVSPDNRFVYAADLGIDQVRGYRLSTGEAKLSSNRQPFVRTPPGAGPRHLTFHPNGNHLYVINELANSVTVFNYDSHSGILIEQQTIATLPRDFDGESYCADVKITPNGRFLYGTNRGHDSIAAYRIDESGQLSLLQIEPSLGAGPQNLAITPGGEVLLCANMPGNHVRVFRINPDTGALTALGEPVTMPSPSCILVYEKEPGNSK